MTQVIKDLKATTFCVRGIEKHSSLAYNIVNEVHWYNQNIKHACKQTMLRHKVIAVYIIQLEN